MAKIDGLNVPDEVLDALKNEDDPPRMSAKALVARCVGDAVRSRLRGPARAAEKAKLSHTDYAPLEAAQRAEDKAAEDMADAAVESIIIKVK